MTASRSEAAVSDSGKKEKQQKAAVRRTANRTGFSVLYRKELCEYVTSWRVLLLFVLLVLVTAASLNGAISNMSDAVEKSSGYIFLKLFTTNGKSIYSFAVFIAFLGPLMGIAMGFDAIANEKSQGTLIRIAAQPIYRDSIINAKFLAGASVITWILFMLGGVMAGAGILKTGIGPSGEEVARVLVFLVFASVYCCMWLAFSIFLSVVCRHAATAAIVALAIWLFTTMFMSLTASGIANALYPTDGAGAYTNTLSNYQLKLGLNRLSPYYLFSEVISTILNPNVRSTGITTMTQYQNAVAGYLSFGQSLLLVWPHLVYMVALACVAFAAAYISFMKREIRA